MLSTVLAALVLGGGQERGYGMAVGFCSIADERVNESSGVAASRLGSGVFYTHNDSGDSARFFRFDRAGKVTGVFSLKGVKALDWEDMDSVKVDGKSYLYLGDIGDNARVRKSIQIHKVEEPTGAGRELAEFETYTVTYPDKARDCEGMFVNSQTGDIYLVTKARDQETVVYKLRKPAKSGSYTLEKLGNIEVRLPGLGGNLVTGAAVSPDGKFVVVRTYSDALEYPVTGKFDDWIKAKPIEVDLRQEKQGEAICYTGDGGSLLTTSEYSPCVVSRVPLKR